MYSGGTASAARRRKHAVAAGFCIVAMIYMDNSATTRPYDEVIDLMGELMREGYGNPSSLHRLGMKAESYVEEAREKVAGTLGARPDEIYFTSGGTESDNTAVLAGAEKMRHTGRKVVTTAIEHPAVLEAVRLLMARGYEGLFLPVGREGTVDPEEAARAVQGAGLLSVMHVNNETGAVQPIAELGRRKDAALFHVDMVQSFGKLPIDLSGEYAAVDMATVSAHKIHGPKGVGALYVRKGLVLAPLLVGGGQEKAMRSGTENVPAIAGFGRAAELIYQRREEKNAHLFACTEYMRNFFAGEVNDALINSPENAAPHIVSVSFPGTRAEVLLHALEQEEIYVSTGSACSSNKKGGSHVIAAMGRTAREVEGTLRFSLCDDTTMDDVKETCQKTKAAVERFRALGSFR